MRGVKLNDSVLGYYEFVSVLIKMLNRNEFNSSKMILKVFSNIQKDAKRKLQIILIYYN